MRGPAPFVLQLIRLDWPSDESAFTAKTPEETWSFIVSHKQTEAVRSPLRLPGKFARVAYLPPEQTEAVPATPAFRDIITSLLSDRPEAEQQLRSAVDDHTGSKSAAVLNGLAVIAHSMASGTWPDDLSTSSHIAIKRALLTWYRNHLAMGPGTTGPDALMCLETFHLAFLHLLVCPSRAVPLDWTELCF